MLLEFSLFLTFLNDLFCSTLRDVFTLDFCYVSFVCDHSHSFKFDVFQLNMSWQFIHTWVFPDGGFSIERQDHHTSCFSLVFGDFHKLFQSCTADSSFATWASQIVQSTSWVCLLTQVPSNCQMTVILQVPSALPERFDCLAHLSTWPVTDISMMLPKWTCSTLASSLSAHDTRQLLFVMATVENTYTPARLEALFTSFQSSATLLTCSPSSFESDRVLGPSKCFVKRSAVLSLVSTRPTDRRFSRIHCCTAKHRDSMCLSPSGPLLCRVWHAAPESILRWTETLQWSSLKSARPRSSRKHWLRRTLCFARTGTDWCLLQALVAHRHSVYIDIPWRFGAWPNLRPNLSHQWFETKTGIVPAFEISYQLFHCLLSIVRLKTCVDSCWMANCMSGLPNAMKVSLADNCAKVGVIMTIQRNRCRELHHCKAPTWSGSRFGVFPTRKDSRGIPRALCCFSPRSPCLSWWPQNPQVDCVFFIAQYHHIRQVQLGLHVLKIAQTTTSSMWRNRIESSDRCLRFFFTYVEGFDSTCCDSCRWFSLYCGHLRPVCLVNVVFVVLLVASLASMRWLLCGGDGWK